MRHSQEEWKELINNFKESGLSQRKWCAIYAPNRKKEIPYVFKAMVLDDVSKIRACIKCRAGKI